MRLATTLGVIAASAFLAGCSNGSITPAPTVFSNSSANALQTAVKAAADPDNRLVFFANSKENYVEFWHRTNNSLDGVISPLQEPIGLATDADNVLYVANSGASNILAFAPPYGNTPTSTLTDAGEVPNGVAVANDGTVGVTNTCAVLGCRTKTGSVVFFARATTAACATIPIPDYDTVTFGAFDKAGNFYFDGTLDGKVVVSVISGGCNATKYTELATDYVLKSAGGMQFGPHGYLSVLDTKSESIDSFSVNGSSLTKKTVTPLDSKTTIRPTAFAFTGNGDAVFVVNTGGGSADKFEFPAGGDTKNTYSIGGKPSGVAITPAYQP